MSTFYKILTKIIEESTRVLVNREDHVKLIVFTIVAGGHALIEGIPGIAKTLTAKVVAKLLNLKFSRIQCTLDLLPSDVIGTKVYNQKTGEFEIRIGPVYANIVLVDEINRATPRAQAALLEAMQEKQVTIEGETIKLPTPFSVLATQNPIELEGTFPLPEAQLDRFYIKIHMNSLDRDSLVQLLKRSYKYLEREYEMLKPIVTVNEVFNASEEIDSVYVDDDILRYISRIVEYSHKHPASKLGVSPRGAIMLLTLSREFALAENRKYVIPDDVKMAAVPALSHRIFLKPEYVVEGYNGIKVVSEIISHVEVPKP
ncbi:MAG: MoxR family ATPase [Ignisphaera sp.]|nr:MoxR family ATPase [Ignisphaera sp.]MDW8084973.1 MoxR family ATPase [Ignisphaera sp.]